MKVENATLKLQIKAQEETFMARREKIILQAKELHRKQVQALAAQAGEIELLKECVSMKEQGLVRLQQTLRENLKILESKYTDEKATMIDIMKAREEAHQQALQDLKEAHEKAMEKATVAKSLNKSGEGLPVQPRSAKEAFRGLRLAFYENGTEASECTGVRSSFVVQSLLTRKSEEVETAKDSKRSSIAPNMEVQAVDEIDELESFISSAMSRFP